MCRSPFQRFVVHIATLIFKLFTCDRNVCGPWRSCELCWRQWRPRATSRSTWPQTSPKSLNWGTCGNHGPSLAARTLRHLPATSERCHHMGEHVVTEWLCISVFHRYKSRNCEAQYPEIIIIFFSSPNAINKVTKQSVKHAHCGADCRVSFWNIFKLIGWIKNIPFYFLDYMWYWTVIPDNSAAGTKIQTLTRESTRSIWVIASTTSCKAPTI